MNKKILENIFIKNIKQKFILELYNEVNKEYYNKNIKKYFSSLRNINFLKFLK